MLRPALAMVLALSASAAAITSALPGTQCAPSSVHQYVAAPPGAASEPLVLAPPGCEGGDPHFGVGGAFLAADHHDDLVCIADDVAADASFYATVDGDGDGVLTQDAAVGDLLAGPFEGCATIPFEPGADGGWWILLGPRAIAGHVIS